MLRQLDLGNNIWKSRFLLEINHKQVTGKIMKNLILILCLSFSVFSFSQKKEKINLINSTWGQEIIKIPFGLRQK